MADLLIVETAFFVSNLAVSIAMTPKNAVKSTNALIPKSRVRDRGTLYRSKKHFEPIYDRRHFSFAGFDEVAEIPVSAIRGDVGRLQSDVLR